ncbi:class I SAM-dependent methyltransferase [Oceanobacillus manasiensis]|uniref:class I SAM-dependent methyltransferase n=1 Tax=Oceanobacillus manasiensis TaxID=586413 RepID=UPI0009FE10DB|nr:class I SAM-dependent methyltransferase [Oceanobacillus manasiensis]
MVMKDIEKRLIEKVFTDNKEAYVVSETHAFGADLKAIPEWLELTREDKILDVATGGGHVAKTLSPYVKQVYAIDLTKEMLAEARKHLENFQNIHFIIGEAEDLPFLDHTFDHIICRTAAHHFTSPRHFIEEVTRVLKPGGSFLLIDNISPEAHSLDTFVNSFEKMRDNSHHRALKISEWKHLFQKNQLSIYKEKPRKKTLPFDDWLHRTQHDRYMRQHVSNFVLGANHEVLNHFQIDIREQRIHSIALDEWMVLVKKE